MRGRWLLAALASGVTAVGTSFALHATSASFLATSLNAQLLDVLPGSFIAFVVRTMGDLALELSLLFSGVVLSAVLGGLAVAAFRLGRRAAPTGDVLAGTVLAAVAVLVPAWTVVGDLVAVLPSALAGAVVVPLVVVIPQADDLPVGGADDSRRTLLRVGAGLVAVNAVTHALGLVRRGTTQRSERELQQQAHLREIEHLLTEAREEELGVEDVTGLVTPVEDFYKVDINPTPPSVDADSWTLSVTGAVEEELDLDYAAVQDQRTIHRFKTLRCLGDRVDGEQMDTALWTGCSLGNLVEQAGPQGEYAVFRGVDEYYYTVPLSYLDDAMLVWGMNGLELPQAHGYPVRALLPNRWGKLSVKWLTEVEILDESASGYWEERGWNGMGTVNTVTKIERINRPDDGGIQVAGHAYAGTRGIETVEVSVDGGDTWNEARLSGELPDEDTWRQWVYEWEGGADGYEVVARARDGEGTLQPEAETDPYPDGATGWVSRQIRG